MCGNNAATNSHGHPPNHLPAWREGVPRTGTASRHVETRPTSSLQNTCPTLEHISDTDEAPWISVQLLEGWGGREGVDDCGDLWGLVRDGLRDGVSFMLGGRGDPVDPQLLCDGRVVALMLLARQDRRREQALQKFSGCDLATNSHGIHESFNGAKRIVTWLGS